MPNEYHGHPEGCEIRCSGRVSISCPARGTRHDTQRGTMRNKRYMYTFILLQRNDIRHHRCDRFPEVCNQILMPTITLFEGRPQSRYHIILLMQLWGQQLCSSQKFLIIWACSGIANQLRHKHPIRRRGWDVATQDREVYDGEIKVIPFIIQII